MGNTMKHKILTMMALAGMLAYFPAEAATQAEIDKAIGTCTKDRDTKGGQMPWGANDRDIESYRGSELCTNNQGRPLGENCQKTLNRLLEVATDLNKMVKEGCNKFMPMFVSNKELENCMKDNGSQTACTEANLKQLAPVKAQLAVFRAQLKKFAEAMKEQQKYVAQSSDNVVQVLKENQSARNTPAYRNGGYSASQMAVSSISESDRLNNFEDAAKALSILQKIKERFEDSESRYATVSEKTYNQHLKPIETSFQEVEQLKSKVLREQLHGFIKAEELKLATKLYDNQLTETEKTTNQLIATNEKTASNLNSIASAAGAAAPALSSLGGQASSGVGGANSYGSTGGLSSGNNSSPSSADKGSTALAKIDSGKTTSGTGQTGEEGTISNSSAASRSPASASSLKESLRRKLAAGKNGEATDASMAMGGSAAAGAEGAKGAKGKSTSMAGAPGYKADGITLAGGSAADPMLEGFNVGSLDQGGLYIPGSSLDQSVKELVGEFESAIGANHQMSDDIGALDGASLFARVREFHGRCLKRGCVTGAGKGDL